MLQQDCCALYVQGLGHHQSILFAIPNGEKRDKITASILTGGMNEESRARLAEIDQLMPVGQGVIPGPSDLVLLTPGPTTTWIECKRAEDRMRGVRAGCQSRWQKLFEKRATAMGHDYRVIENTTEFYDLLVEKGVKLRIMRPWLPVALPPPGISLPPAKQRKAAVPRSAAQTEPAARQQPSAQKWEP